MKMKTRPVCLFIMDGYGINPETRGNAIKAANAGVIERLAAEYPHTKLAASGENVGLPDGQMGNSEVGHLNIGAGRIIRQELSRITYEIQTGEFFTNPALVKVMDDVKKNGKKLHLYGLLSDGGVHSHITHLYALLKMAKERGLTEVYVHCFMDGRDVSPTSGIDFIAALQAKMQEIGIGEIASISGRYYAMDRDKNWDRVEKAYDMLTTGEGVQATDPVQAMKDSYAAGVTDEFVLPTKIYKNGKPLGLIEAGDGIVFFDYRPDRARQITRAFSEKDFDGFERKTGFLNPEYVCFTEYDATLKNVSIAFGKQHYANTLSEYLSNKGYTQLKIAETEKYAHVTFFFNGGVEAPNANEDRILVPSPKVATYDLKPEMSAYEVTDKVLAAINSDKYDVIILNYANCDMVGHTGVFDAAVKAVQTVEGCMDKIVAAVLAKGGSALITADHGNADKMIDENGKPFTAHTTNLVPFILVSEQYKNVRLKEGGILADIAPTMLTVMGEEVPAEMTGKCLIED